MHSTPVLCSLLELSVMLFYSPNIQMPVYAPYYHRLVHNLFYNLLR
uniref:Uncharacterized protein n=1 Tax=Brugia timori TaxID=42155 RepID=A0A0R3Q5C9_9BILA